MKRILTLLFVIISFTVSAQSWINTGNTLQFKVISVGDTVWRFSLGAPGFLGFNPHGGVTDSTVFQTRSGLFPRILNTASTWKQPQTFSNIVLTGPDATALIATQDLNFVNGTTINNLILKGHQDSTKAGFTFGAGGAILQNGSNSSNLNIGSNQIFHAGNLSFGSGLNYSGGILTATGLVTSLTTTGSSGASTLSSGVLNVPNYTISGLGGITASSTDVLTNKTISGSSNTITNIPNSALTNNTISGVALGANLNGLNIGYGLLPNGTNYNGSAAVFLSSDTSKLQTIANFKPLGNTFWALKNGSNASGTWGISITGNANTVTTNANLTGDVTSSGNATTLATVNSNVGSFGTTTSIPSFTVNAKGLITAASGNTISYQTPITLTTTGTSGAATLTGATLNIPQYSGGATWGSITGTLGSQTDLQNALNLKANIASPTFTTNITTPLALISGTAGSGYIDLISQSVSPASSSGHLRIYSDSLNRFSYKNSTYRRTIQVPYPSDVTVRMPYKATPTLADSSDIANKYVNQLNYIGYIYNQTGWTTGTLASDFTANGLTPTITGTGIQLTGGASNYVQTLNKNNPTSYEKWTQTLTYVLGTINSTSYGIGIGLQSTNTNSTGAPSTGPGLYNLAVQLNTSTGSGLLNISTGTGTTQTIVGSSPTSLTFSTGDTIIVTLSRQYNSIIATAYNHTTKSAPITAVYSYILTYPTVLSMPNTGLFCIYNFGGTNKIIGYQVYSNEITNADWAFIGDSKTVGYYSGSLNARFANLVAQYFTTQVFAGGYDKTYDVLLGINAIIAAHPKNVVLAIGSNDLRVGESLSTIETNYALIHTTLTAAGINVYDAQPFYETNVNQISLSTWISSTYASTYISIPLQSYSGTASTVLAPDGVHPTTFAHTVIANSLIASGLFTKATMSSLGLPTLDNVLGYGNATTQTAIIGGLNVNGIANVTGPININNSSNADVAMNITNTSTGTAANSAIHIGPDMSTNFSTINYPGSGYTANGVITAHSLDIYTNQGPTNIINATNSPINFNINGAATANTRMSLSSTGLTNSFANTSGANLTMTNSVSTYASVLSLINNTGNQGNIFKSGSAYPTSGILSPNDFILYNSSAAGNIDIFNSFSTGTIKFAAGNSSTSNLTINANGSSTFGSTINAVAGTTTIASLNIPSGVIKTSGQASGDIANVSGIPHWYDGASDRTIAFSPILATVAAISGTATAATLLYTVPTGRTLVITGFNLNCTAATGVTVGPLYTITASTAGTIISSQTTGMTTAGQIYEFPITGLTKTVTAGETVSINITAATGTSQSLTGALIGYLQ